MHLPIPGCTGLRTDNLAHNPEFESTGPWNSFELGSGPVQGSTLVKPHNLLNKNATRVARATDCDKVARCVTIPPEIVVVFPVHNAATEPLVVATSSF